MFLCMVKVFIIWLISTLTFIKVTKKHENIFTEKPEAGSFNTTQLPVKRNPITEQMGRSEKDRPGQMGKPVDIPTDLPKNISEMIDQENLLYGFHQYRSDLIGYRRTLPDQRDKWCKNPNRYLKDLPSTSIIIPVYDEAWSAVIRTVNSIIINSPPELIHEIILIIDSPELPHLNTLLDDQFTNFYFLNLHLPSLHSANYSKVKILRTKKRKGLIQAKNLGAQLATGQILTFMDAHCECTKGWLEPLLDRIARNSTTAALPIIDLIRNDTFKYYPLQATGVGFSWGLGFRPIPISNQDKLRRTHKNEPFYSPLMFGGLFSISSAFFETLGGYDSGLELWGGENIEISFKVWMCGGCIEVIPCSRVGHIFRSRNLPYHSTNEGINRNIGRIAEVWMEEYIEYYYLARKRVKVGDISSQKALRKQLNCKSFDWYLRNIYPILPIPKECPAYGEIKNVAFRDNHGRSICLDSLGNIDGPVELYRCHGKLGHQYWLLTKAGEIRQDENCLDYFGKGIFLHECHGSKGNQFWEYCEETKLLYHPSARKCLAVGESGKVPVMMECDEEDEMQWWVLQNYDVRKEERNESL